MAVPEQARIHIVGMPCIGRCGRLLETTQINSDKFFGCPKNAGEQISKDGKAPGIDNVFIERLWRSVKYKEVYRHRYENVSHTRAWNSRNTSTSATRDSGTHQSHDYRTPYAVYVAPTATPTATAARCGSKERKQQSLCRLRRHTGHGCKIEIGYEPKRDPPPFGPEANPARSPRNSSGSLIHLSPMKVCPKK